MIKDASNGVETDSLQLFSTLLEGQENKTTALVLKAAFSELDRYETGYLEREPLSHLLRKVIPHASDKETRYFVSMLMDAKNINTISYKDLRVAIKACSVAAQAVISGANSDVRATMNRMYRAVQGHRIRLTALFNAGGSHRKTPGRLNVRDLVDALRELLPDLTADELRYMISVLDYYDTSRDGCVSLSTFEGAIGVYVDAGAKKGSGPSAAPSAPPSASKSATPTPTKPVAQKSRGAPDASASSAVLPIAAPPHSKPAVAVVASTAQPAYAADEPSLPPTTEEKPRPWNHIAGVAAVLFITAVIKGHRKESRRQQLANSRRVYLRARQLADEKDMQMAAATAAVRASGFHSQGGSRGGPRVSVPSKYN
eukprot:jgi/Mesvir1/1991/Mv17951-RA.1